VDTEIIAMYQDPFYPDDVATAVTMVDPFGFVFNTTTGEPVNGAQVTLLNATTGLPATVFGDDGVSSYPSTVTTGSTFTAGGDTYILPPGQFRFPFITEGDYRLDVTPPAGYTTPSSIPAQALAQNPVTSEFVITNGSYGEVFTVRGGPAIRIDTPSDPPAELVVQKSAGRAEATVGDFMPYQLDLSNRVAHAMTRVILTDTLPIGFRYQQGSARENGGTVSDPVISADGRILTFSLSDMAANGATRLEYVVSITAGTVPGDAVNRASATAQYVVVGTPFPARSNTGSFVLRVKPPFFGPFGTIIGRVVEGECDAAWEGLKGVPNVRLMMEDGTYTVTDADGQYHFEQVGEGTHVVQMDKMTLSAERPPASCIQNTRFAGRGFSQFVEMQGGMLWRADFYAGVKKAPDPAPAPMVESPLDPAPPPPMLAPAPAPAPVPPQTMPVPFVGIGLQGEWVAASKQPDQMFALNVHFDFGKASLSTDKMSQMRPLVNELKSLQVNEMIVTGYTDSAPVTKPVRGQFSDNQGLSLLRARLVATYLREELGLSRDRVSVAGHGVAKAVKENNTSEGRSANRRVEVNVVASPPMEPPRLTYRIDVSGGEMSVQNVRIMAHLPTHATFLPGTVAVEGLTVSDPLTEQGVTVFHLGDIPANGHRAITFEAVGSVPLSRRHLMRAHFDNGSALMNAAEMSRLDEIAKELTGREFDYLEIIGHTDSNPINAPRKVGFANNATLSEARAQAAALYLADKLGLSPGRIKVGGYGPDEPIGDNATPEGRALNRRVVVIAHQKQGKWACPNGGDLQMDAYALFNTEMETDVRTPTAETMIPCGQAASQPASTYGQRIEKDKGSPAPSQIRRPSNVGSSLATPISFSSDRLQSGRPFAADSVYESHLTAGDVLYAVAPLARPVWVATPVEDAAVSPLLFAQNINIPARAPSPHRPTRMAFLPDRSFLIADGITPPTLAIRFMDKEGHPVDSSVSGSYTIHPPYLSLQEIEMTQKRALAGLDRFHPVWTTEGDDGIAFIRLAPTMQAGEVVADIGMDEDRRVQEIRVRLQPSPRDFVLVGFAEGTVGYNTLKGNAEALDANRIEDNLYTDGQVSLYAKGKIRGEWLLTLAFDSDKPEHLRRRESLFGVVDPAAFYTLYGDATGQRYDAPSQRNLYIKIERKAFMALFGDFETGLNQTRLSRYSRALNGMKANYSGKILLFTAFAAETPQRFAKDEIQGDGTSGLYRLSHGALVLNSERVQITTRDRFRADQTIATRLLTRHLDYDIDYGAGTLFFKAPVAARDNDFNPVVIVVEYEVLGVASQALNAGGRLGVRLMDGAVQLGVSQIRDEANRLSTDLSGLDMTLKLDANTTLRLEGALLERNGVGVLPAESKGEATLAEIERQGDDWGILAYTHRQEAGFGMNQQSAVSFGRERHGLTGRLTLTDPLDLSAETSREKNLENGLTRDLVSSRLEYRGDVGSVFGGLQAVRDETLSGAAFASQQGIVGASRKLINDRLEILGRADFALAGKNDSLDYPSRYLIQTHYDITEETRLIVAHEISDGASFDTQMTRMGLAANPWKGGRLTGTLNQDINEYGPRHYAVYGLSQSFLLGERWGVDVALDQSRAFNESSTALQAPVVNLAQPIASGGSLGGGVLNDDYLALSAGATYRYLLWSWNARVENRDAGLEDRVGLVTSFLREAESGVAFASSLRFFETNRRLGGQGHFGTADLSWAYRPLDFQWSVLDRLEFQHETLKGGSGFAHSGLFGATSLTTPAVAKSRALLNHLNINRVSRVWSERDRQGNLFAFNQQNQWSVYYGSRYRFDQYSGADYKGYTDLVGLDIRHDLTTWIDVGLHAHQLRSWRDHNSKYALGPSIGFTPIENGWLSVGYNFLGFRDRDFNRARYTMQGVYVVLRVKFDHETRLTR
jgi:uncharacterized repeat protein (TIGR01451 family)